MTCLICDEPAVVIDANDYYLERYCPKCGRYRITGAALVSMKAQRYDVELTRKWIAEHQGSGTIPTIDSNQAARLINV
jgi:predicted RNA-binding Zn-ribbon protein involved in translation (DUF1610 family)